MTSLSEKAAEAKKDFTLKWINLLEKSKEDASEEFKPSYEVQLNILHEYLEFLECKK